MFVVVFLRNLNANLGFCSCDGPYIKCVKWFDRLEPQTHRFFFILHTDVYRVPGKPQWLMLVVFITSHEWEYMHVHGVQHDPPPCETADLPVELKPGQRETSCAETKQTRKSSFHLTRIQTRDAACSPVSWTRKKSWSLPADREVLFTKCLLAFLCSPWTPHSTHFTPWDRQTTRFSLQTRPGELTK